MQLIFVGPPGSGKGTQGVMLADKYNLVHLALGDMLRGEVSSNSDLGIKISSIMAEGKLVGDEIVESVIREKICAVSGKNFILDGYPRNENQAKSLDCICTDLRTDITLAIYLKVEDKEIMQRLSQRARQLGRADDNVEVIKKRLQVFSDVKDCLRSFYNKKRIWCEVDGFGTKNEVFDRLTLAIESYV